MARRARRWYRRTPPPLPGNFTTLGPYQLALNCVPVPSCRSHARPGVSDTAGRPRARWRPACRRWRGSGVWSWVGEGAPMGPPSAAQAWQQAPPGSGLPRWGRGCRVHMSGGSAGRPAAGLVVRITTTVDGQGSPWCHPGTGAQPGVELACPAKAPGTGLRPGVASLPVWRAPESAGIPRPAAPAPGKPGTGWSGPDPADQWPGGLWPQPTVALASLLELWLVPNNTELVATRFIRLIWRLRRTCRPPNIIARCIATRRPGSPIIRPVSRQSGLSRTNSGRSPGLLFRRQNRRCLRNGAPSNSQFP